MLRLNAKTQWGKDAKPFRLSKDFRNSTICIPKTVFAALNLRAFALKKFLCVGPKRDRKETHSLLWILCLLWWMPELILAQGVVDAEINSLRGLISSTMNTDSNATAANTPKIALSGT